MAISARSAGSYVDTASSTTLTVTLPTHEAGDMLIVRAACKQYDATITCGTSGWAAVGNAYANGSTTNGNGVGSLNHRSFYKVATSSSETSPVVTFGATPSPGMAVAIVYQKASTDTWETPTGAGGGDSTARTSQTCTISSHISVRTGDMIDFWLAWCDNYASTSPSITQTGVTFDAVTEYPATALSTGTGNDGAMDGGYRLATAGTSSAAAVVTATFGNSEQGGAWQTRLRVIQGLDVPLIDGGRALYAPSVGVQFLTATLIDGGAAIYAPTLKPINTLVVPVVSIGDAEFKRGTQLLADDFSGTSSTTWPTPDTGGAYVLGSAWSNNDNRSEGAGVGLIGAVLIDAHAGLSYSDGLSEDDVEVQVDLEPTSWTAGSDHGGIGYRYNDGSGGFYILALTIVDATHITLTLRRGPYTAAGYSDTTPIASSGSLAVTTAYTWWRIHAFVVGNRHVSRIWAVGDTEPGTWQIDTTDSTYESAGSVVFWDDCTSEDNTSSFDNAGAWQATFEGSGAVLYAPALEQVESSTQDITATLLDGGAALYAPTLIYTQVIDATLIDGSAALYAPTVKGVNTLVAPLIDGSNAIYAPEIKGVNTLVAPLIDGSATLYAPTVTGINTLTVGAVLDGSNAIYAPALQPYNTLTAPLIDGNAALYAPSVYPIQTLAITDVIDGGAALYEPVVEKVGATPQDIGPTVLLDGGRDLYAPTLSNIYYLTAPLIDGGADLYAPSVYPIQYLTATLIDGSAALYAPTLLPINNLTAPLIDGGAALYAPTVMPAQFLTAPLIDGGAAIYAPSVYPTQTLTVGAVLDGGATLYAPSVYPTQALTVGAVLDGGAAIYAPTLYAYNTLTAPLIDGGRDLYAPTVMPDQFLTIADVLDGGATLYEPIVYTNTLYPPVIDGGAELYAPSLLQITFLTITTLADGGRDLYAPTLQPYNTLVAGLIDGGGTLYAPTIKGINLLELPLIDGGNALFDPVVQKVTAPQDITDVPLLDGSATLYAPTLASVYWIIVPLLDGGRDIYVPTISKATVTISGYTRNQYGAIIPNCTVDVFRSSDNEFITSTSSDVNGHYSVDVAAGVEHFLVAYSTAKVYGVTARDIVGV